MKPIIEPLKAEEYCKCSNIWNMKKQPLADKWLQEIKSGNRLVFIYKINGEFIGEGALVRQTDDPDYTIPNRRVYVSRMIVKKEYRNRGIGGEILAFLIEKARCMGYSEMAIGVDKDNVNALHLYEKFGFSEVLFDGADEHGEYLKLMKPLCQAITQRAKTYSDPPERVRVASRGILLDGNKILLSHEVNTGVYMSPGGGLEAGETLEECCIRELREETGYEVKPVKHFLAINEYCFETLYISNYFICELIGKGNQALTKIEVDHGITPEWVEIPKALEIFGEYDSKREDIRSLYLREYTVINKLVEKKLAVL